MRLRIVRAADGCYFVEREEPLGVWVPETACLTYLGARFAAWMMRRRSASIDVVLWESK